MRPLYVKLLQSSITSIRTVRRVVPIESHVVRNVETRDKEVAERFEGAIINGRESCVWQFSNNVGNLDTASQAIPLGGCASRPFMPSHQGLRSSMLRHAAPSSVTAPASYCASSHETLLRKGSDTVA